jgi:hypothetical protein
VGAGVEGAIDREISAAGLTTRPAEPDFGAPGPVDTVAVICTVPVATPVAKPTLLIVAIVASLVDHIAVAVTSSSEPSLYCAVAT